MNYVVISPVKDEERNIERCCESMIRQSKKPLRWVIVDDGSTDRTGELVQRYAARYPFVSLVTIERQGSRRTGVGELLAFNMGYQKLSALNFDLLVKLDGDMSFEEDYFERLCNYFEENPRLGIASGIYTELRGNSWEAIEMPDYHAAGACKVVRRQCFTEIEGFVAQRGWDSVDEIRAMSMGWETKHFPELQMKHWRPEGAGMGYLSTCYMHGEIYYRTGGGALFFLLKCARRLSSRPWIAGAGALAWGYLHNLLKRTPPLVNEQEASFYRSVLNHRLMERLGFRASRS